MQRPDVKNKDYILEGKRYICFEDVAKILGISSGALWSRAERFGIDNPKTYANKVAVATPISYQGKHYKTIREFSKDVNIPTSTLMARVARYGLDSPKVIEPPKQFDDHPFDYNGRHYNSIQEAAEIHKLENGVLYYRIKHKGLAKTDLFAPVGKYQPSYMCNVDFQGKHYRSLADLAKEYQINYGTLLSRIRRSGFYDDLDLVRPPQEQNHENDSKRKPITILNQTFPSIAAACRHFDINRRTLMDRIKKGISCDDPAIIAKPKPKGYGQRHPITYQGKTYPSIKAMAEAFGISYGTMKMRISTHGLDNPHLGDKIMPRKQWIKGGREIKVEKKPDLLPEWYNQKRRL